MNFQRFSVFAILLLLSSCFLSKQKKETVHIPYQLSYDPIIYADDPYIGRFIPYLSSSQNDNSSMPDSIMEIANRSIDQIKSKLKVNSPEGIVRLEFIHFYLLEHYLLPVYQQTGQKKIEENILSTLVELKKLNSRGELLLQVRSLYAISQGGYYYPELQDHYETLLKSHDQIPESKRVDQLLNELNSRSTH